MSVIKVIVSDACAACDYVTLTVRVVKRYDVPLLPELQEHCVLVFSGPGAVQVMRACKRLILKNRLLGKPGGERH